jgi:hypothetical protein
MRVQVDEPISAEDYFKKNPEFRVWLAESKGKKFGDLCLCVCVCARARVCKYMCRYRYSGIPHVYLYTLIGDLDVKEAKKYFEKFVEKYNAGELPSKIYEGIAFRYVQARERARAIAKERGERILSLSLSLSRARALS